MKYRLVWRATKTGAVWFSKMIFDDLEVAQLNADTINEKRAGLCKCWVGEVPDCREEKGGLNIKAKEEEK